MLDNETKRRIDTARDILVGKVPDPKSQVEQITIALIYKFMDDMDLEAEELGGHPNFFTGEYEKYGWRKIFDPALGGHEMLGLYGDAITRMALNPNLPQLFRDIFKNAYLPYRDPETLKSFLKIIDDFNYDQSEKLGDAFEYLLSVLGSQGDAGQFRTPRHIIDFMTAILNPRKTESILDPACGTAGFLISAFKHILKFNSSNYNPDTDQHAFEQHGIKLDELTINGKKYQGDRLTPDDRTRITSNIRGYDISPDMVRLSLVNLYLHGFPEPHIYEYDSLTSEDRWNEFYDVILANPPFMSPKGGIRPHKRFSVQSNRSEVLFVDLMAEHLTPGGRAAIVVPEGIIFQSGAAYKSLRKMLVEDYLVGVISLPAGVFNPYSGVKTSILWLDKSLARKTDQILFAKITADGFDLGAQRRPVKQNDLPGAFRAIQQYIDFLQTGSISMDSNDNGDTDAIVRTRHGVSPQSSSDSPESTLQSIYPHISLVAKSAIAENGDYNLSGERYKESTIIKNTKFDLIEIGELANLINGRAFKPNDWEPKEKGGLPIVRIQNLNNHTAEFNYYSGHVDEKLIIQPNDLLFSWSGSRGTSFGAHIWHGGKAILNQHIFKVKYDDSKILKKYFLHALNKSVEEVEQNLHGGVGLVHITKGNLERIKIPLPPLSIQQEIVAEIEAYQKIIDGARQVVENYKPCITIDPDWEMVELGEIAHTFQYGSSNKSLSEGNIPCLRMGNIQNGEIDWNDLKYAPEDEDFEKYLLRENDVLFNRTNSPVLVGKTAIVRGNRKAVFAGYLIRIVYKQDKIMGQYLNYSLNTQSAYDFCQRVKTDGINQSNINAKILATFQIPLPPLETQQQIVAQIEREQALVNANKELIALFEQKIKDRIARVWGE